MQIAKTFLAALEAQGSESIAAALTRALEVERQCGGEAAEAGADRVAIVAWIVAVTLQRGARNE